MIHIFYSCTVYSSTVLYLTFPAFLQARRAINNDGVCVRAYYRYYLELVSELSATSLGKDKILLATVGVKQYMCSFLLLYVHLCEVQRMNVHGSCFNIQ